MSNLDEVAINNLPVELDFMLERLRKEFNVPDLILASPPQPLGGGFWAENWSLSLVPQIESVLHSRLVLRLAPDTHLAAWENTFQIGVAKQGFPTPQIYSAESAQPLRRAWCVMDFVDGHPLLSSLDGVRTLATLLRLATVLAAAQVADPAFDLAYTYMLLANPPLAAPRALRPEINWAGRRMTNRFVASYVKRSIQSVNLDAFDWYRSLQAFRILFDLAYWRANDSTGARRDHPWFIMEPALRQLVGKS